ncbi:hypothetical protein [Roseinatronobacter bogoriensis]|uniref:hypothetical protein n=1 Tax=Roseinatronobacter bogoriensis TaxID=119542 RepID=UPI0018E28192|nr:hypothetical protein [Rhodobaca barguzinensis]
MNRDILADQGCVYLGPDRLRRDLKIPGLHRRPKAIATRIKPLLEVVQAEQAAGRRLLLSDENIMGGGPKPPALAQGEILYPKLQSQITVLLDALELRDVTVCLALRNPLDLLVSAWGHQFRRGDLQGFDHFCADVAPLALRWSEVVLRVLSCGGVKNVLVWRHEDYARLLNPLLIALSGCRPDTALRHPERDGGSAFLIGPSARALQLVPELIADTSGLDAKVALRRAMRRFPKSHDHPAPQPFRADQVAQAKAQYLADWDKLAGMTGVACLTP